MNTASVIIILIAYGILAFSIFFTKRKGIFYFVSTALTILTLVVAIMLCANYKNNFSGFTITALISCIPLLFMLYEPIHPQFKKVKEDEEGKTFDVVFDSDYLVIAEDVEKPEENIDLPPEKLETLMTDAKGVTMKATGKKSTSVLFTESHGTFFPALGFMLSALILTFAGLYIGKESFFTFLCGIPLGAFGFCFAKFQAKKKNTNNIFDILATTLYFAGAGFLIGSIASAVLYSISVPTIMYAAGCLLMAVFAILKNTKNLHYFNIALFVGFALIAVSIII